MKLRCKCGKPLTKDLYLTKYHKYQVDDITTKMRSGCFKLSRATPTIRNKYSNEHPAQLLKPRPEVIMVSINSILCNIPEMPKGCGCCNWSGGHELMCGCGRVIGEMYLDCYELGFVDFLTKNVVRCYK